MIGTLPTEVVKYENINQAPNYTYQRFLHKKKICHLCKTQIKSYQPIEVGKIKNGRCMEYYFYHQKCVQYFSKEVAGV